MSPHSVRRVLMPECAELISVDCDIVVVFTL